MKIEKDDLDIIRQLQAGENENECIKELVLRHSGIYLSIIHSYIPSQSALINKEDLINDKEYHIYQAALKFDEDKKSKFSTFLGKETKWMCLNLHNKNKNKNITPFDETINPSVDSPFDNGESCKEDFIKKILEITKAHPDKRVNKIFKMRYIDGEKNGVMPWRKIGRALNMSIQGCINIHNSAISNIKQKLLKEV